MKLVIAEKRSVANAIINAVGKDYTVIALRGHIYEHVAPDEYLPDDIPRNSKGNKEWRQMDLPIIPQKWRRKLKNDCKAILDTVSQNLLHADEVIHAGDADREGQLLVDEVLEELGYKGTITRVWLQSLTPASIQAAFKMRRPNTDLKSLSHSAQARSRADWLLGMNLSRSYILKHNSSKLSVGRVQTPTLAMIVERDLERESFEPESYLEVHALVKHRRGELALQWIPASTTSKSFDEERRLINKRLADRIVSSAKGTGIVTNYTELPDFLNPPLPFNLSELQKLACQKFGMSAANVIGACQSLYEAGAITYPRTNCRYVSSQSMAGIRAMMSDGVESELCASSSDHAAFDDHLVTAHSAIMPTEQRPTGLSGDEERIYELISKSAKALLMPPAHYLNTHATIKLNGESWCVNSKRILDKGWTVLSPKQPETFFPPIQMGDTVEFLNTEIKQCYSKPPLSYTDGSLIDDMVNIHRRVSDSASQDILKKSGGLGTEATRAAIIEELLRKRLIERHDKYLRSTDSGRFLIESVSPELRDPVITAQWEQKLSKIVAGEINLDAFQSEVTSFTREQIAKAFRGYGR